ncbi:MAG: aminotransferase class I/II-fold pyridoxal phosphate-dependent enzyme, partial [Jatrophihabitans sp.]
EVAGCAWATDRSAVVVNSFSKYFSMTGWRIGWLLVPDDLLDAVERLTGNFTICPPTLSQLGAVGAFDAYDELDANVARYGQNRQRLLDALPGIGLDRLAPADGAFYVYADVSRWTEDSMGFASRLLADTGVAVVPGLDFDPVEGHKFIRMCFAGDGDDIVRAVELMGGWLARN